MTILSIGQLTALEAGLIEYIELAASAGCQKVSLMVQSAGPNWDWQLATRKNLGDLKQKLADTGLGVLNAECFMLVPGVNVEDYRPALELAAELEANGVTVLIYDPDKNQVMDNLAKFCELARQEGLRANIEFMPLGALCRTLGETVSMIQELQQPNIGIAIDLLHLIRSGGTPEDIAAAPPGLISYAQLCDSEDLAAHNNYAEEAATSRLAPGQGKFPIKAFLQALPPGTPVEIEVPQPGVVPVTRRVEQIVAATRAELRKAGL